MHKIEDDLWETEPQSPFPGMYTHAYFLKCAEGNVLIYNTSNESDFDWIEEKGGINIQYLSHRDEVSSSLSSIKKRFNSDLACHYLEQEFVEKFRPVNVVIEGSQTHFSGIQIIHSPGHTNGSISFLYDSPQGLRYLFTGDTLFYAKNKWNSLIFPGHDGDKNALIKTLQNYISLEPDLVISSGSSEPITCTPVTSEEWANGINKLISRL